MPKPKATKPPDAPLADRLREALAAVPKGKTGREPSPLREHVAAVFERLAAQKQAGATWDGLAGPFAALGILTAERRAPTGVDLKNAFHAERYARGARRKRRAPQPKAVQGAPSSPARLERPEPPAAVPPRPEPPAVAPGSVEPAPGRSAPVSPNPYAEVERRTAEARRRREQAEAAKRWDPYATPPAKEGQDE